MKLNTKKLAKIISLVITSMLIATVSAEVYRYMYIDGSVTIGSPTMLWHLGADGTSEGGSISGNTATIDLDVEQYVPANFTEVFFLENANATGTYNILISLNTAVPGADYDECLMHIYENWTAGPTWTYLDSIDLTNIADTYSDTIDAGDFLRMSFEVNATAASGTDDFDIQVRYD